MTDQGSHTRTYCYCQRLTLTGLTGCNGKEELSVFLSPCDTKEHIGGEIFLVLLKRVIIFSDNIRQQQQNRNITKTVEQKKRACLRARFVYSTEERANAPTCFLFHIFQLRFTCYCVRLRVRNCTYCLIN